MHPIKNREINTDSNVKTTKTIIFVKERKKKRTGEEKEQQQSVWKGKN